MGIHFPFWHKKKKPFFHNDDFFYEWFYGLDFHNKPHKNKEKKSDKKIELSLLGTFESGVYDESAAEIVAHDPQSQRLFVTNGNDDSIDILDLYNPKMPTKINAISVGDGGPNSVDVKNGIVAVAVEADDATDAGFVKFYDTDGNFLGQVVVGSLPDMLTFSEDGTRLLVANEGESAGGDNEPDVLPNPNGSVSIIEIDTNDLSASSVTTLDFSDASISFASLKAKGVRVNEDAPSAAADIEPEYITIEGNTAYISLQENNAVAVIRDITNPSAFTIDDILALGTKDHSLPGNGLDASNKDDAINIANYDIKGLFQPDSISSYTFKGKQYFVTANEGDGRDVDETRGKDLVDGDLSNGEIDTRQVSAELQAQLADQEQLGRLKFSNVDGDTDGDGLIEELHAFGGRSFTIFDENGNMIFDSADMFEQITAAEIPDLFNNDEGDFDDRSDDKGPEPEAITIGKVDGATYAFVGLERTSGVMVFNISNPKKVKFVEYFRVEEDIAPEGFDFIPAEESPTGSALLAVANEVSGTTSLYKISFEGNTVKGTWRSETLKGTGGDDKIFGIGGHDIIKAKAGDDYIKGGRGNDIIKAGDGDDEIDGGLGHDFVKAGDGDDRVIASRGYDKVDGGKNTDTLVFSGNYDDYKVDIKRGIVTDLRPGHRDGIQKYKNVEFLEFADKTVRAQNFTLELLHFTDQEASTSAIQDAPNLSAVLNALRNQDLGNDGVKDNTLTLSSGDAFIPGLFFSASEVAFGSGGIADIQIQNELGVQAIALGNHEFDFGTEVLSDLIDGSAPGDVLGEDFKGTNFAYLSSNLDFSTDANMAPLEVAGGQAPQGNSVTKSVIIDVNGENIGVVGATTPTLDVISSPGDLGIFPTDFDGTPTDAQLDALASVIQAEVDALLANNPGLNKVILLAHMQQLNIELALAERLTDVDIIVAGGSNTRLFDDNDRPRDGDSDQGEYPQFVDNAGGTKTVVVNTDGSYKYVGRLVIEFDENGDIVADSYDEDVSGAYATDDQGVGDLNAEAFVDPEVQQIVDAIETEIIATEGNVFGVSNVFLNGNRTGTGDATDPDGVRSQETNLGNLTADANLEIAQDFDASVVVSIKNGGGIRESIGQTVVLPGDVTPTRIANEEVVDGDGNIVKPEGGISQNDIAATLRFNNGLTLLTVTKSELIDILDHGVGDIGGGRFPQVSGVRFSYDPNAGDGARIIDAGIFDENGVLQTKLIEDGTIVGDANETFRIVTLNFLAGGGDGYPFPQGASANRVDLNDLDNDGNGDGVRTGDAVFADNGTEQDALAEYLNDNHADAASAFDIADTGENLDTRIVDITSNNLDIFA